jgi:membrane fusion protein (multidrug efflux system)
MKLDIASLRQSSTILIALTVATLTGCGQSKPIGREGGAGLLSVDALVVHPQLLLNQIYSTGTLMANEEVELRPEIAGRIVGVYFDEGRRITKGELMLKINDRELLAQQKRKELEEKQASDEERRKKQLFDINVISQEEYDKSLNALRLIQAEKEVIESQLAKTEIRAPFDGVVGLRYVSEGGYVSPSMLAATMQDLDPMKVEFSVPEKYAQLLKDGTEIVVRVGDLPGGSKGIVYAIESKIDQGTRTIKARARIPNPSEQLVPGSFAKVEITLEALPNAIVIPTGALIPEISGEKVFVCTNGKARSVKVNTGIRTDKSIQITEGLSPSDTLIVTGLLQLADGKGIAIQSLLSN